MQFMRSRQMQFRRVEYNTGGGKCLGTAPSRRDVFVTFLSGSLQRDMLVARISTTSTICSTTSLLTGVACA